MIDRPDDDLPPVDHLVTVYDLCGPFLTCGPVPEAFTPEHLALVPGSQPWLASVVRAALARWAEEQGIGAPVPRAFVEASSDIAAHGIIPGVRAWGETPESGVFRRMRAARDLEQQSRAS
ncbi:hypothetical protein ACQPX6_10285 [Actinomycetospora sp. CA-101289]|uniref:hypothetical protein n=1 Tax=Actinomycetospora sp. CA-101289 TaxID=3239893 RepID=UPI003D9743E9